MSNLYVGLIVIVGLVSTVFLLRFIVSTSGNSKEFFEAPDGTRFSSKKDFNEYDFLYKRLKSLYEEKKNANLGLSENFVNLIKLEGFSTLNLLISNKEQFKKLVELFDVSEISNDSDSAIKPSN